MFSKRFHSSCHRHMWSCQESSKDFTSFISHSLLSLGKNLIWHHDLGSCFFFFFFPGICFILFLKVSSTFVITSKRQAKLIL